MITRSELDRILTVAFSPYGFARIDECFVEAYYHGLKNYGLEEIRRAVFACCYQHGRKDHPKPGEVLAEIARVRRQDAINQTAIEQTKMLALDGPSESPERRAAVVEACRPVIDLLGTRASPEALKEAHNKMSLSLAKLRGESNGH